MAWNLIRNLFGNGEEEVAEAQPQLWYPGPPRDFEWRVLYDGGRYFASGLANSMIAGHMADDALAALRLDIGAAELAAGPDAPDLMPLYHSMLKELGRNGAHDACRRLGARLLSAAERDPAIGQADLATVEVQLGQLELNAGDADRALRLYRQALERRQSALGPDHRHTAMLADFIADMEADPESIMPAPPDPYEYVQRMDMVAAIMPTGRLDLAELEMREALSAAICTFGASSAEASHTHRELGRLLAQQGYYGEARRYFMHHADIEAVCYGEDGLEAKAALALIQANAADIAAFGPGSESPNRTIQAVRSDDHLHAWLLAGDHSHPVPGTPVWGLIGERWSAGVQGGARRAEVAFEVGTDGRARNCAIAVSSGSQQLDGEVVSLVADQLRFARDSSRPVSARLALSLSGDRYALPEQMSTEISNRGVAWRDGGWIWAHGHGEFPRRARLRSGTISDDDYPPRAMRDEEQGLVVLGFTVTPEGRVEDAEVVTSSGSQVLDSETLRLISHRFRYEPARDERGEPVAERCQQSVRWLLPD